MTTTITCQVFQWVFETDFVYLFCKTIKNQRVILKVYSLNLQSYVLVDPCSLIEDLVDEFQSFLLTNAFPCQLTYKKRFGTFFDATGENHRQFKFVAITHPSNGYPLHHLRNLFSQFERRHDISLKNLPHENRSGCPHFPNLSQSNPMHVCGN